MAAAAPVSDDSDSSNADARCTVNMAFAPLPLAAETVKVAVNERPTRSSGQQLPAAALEAVLTAAAFGAAPGTGLGEKSSQ